jgi:hypothetical protein
VTKEALGFGYSAALRCLLGTEPSLTDCESAFVFPKKAVRIVCEGRRNGCRGESKLINDELTKTSFQDRGLPAKCLRWVPTYSANGRLVLLIRSFSDRHEFRSRVLLTLSIPNASQKIAGTTEIADQTSSHGMTCA